MPVVDGLPVPVVRWHVAPRKPAPGPPQHPVDYRAVIGPPATALRGLIGQQWLQPGPLLIGQIVTIEHADGLPHPPFKIRGTRSRGLITCTGAALPGAASVRFGGTHPPS